MNQVDADAVEAERIRFELEEAKAEIKRLGEVAAAAKA